MVQEQRDNSIAHELCPYSRYFRFLQLHCGTATNHFQFKTGPQTCGICGKVSANRKALRTHLTIHSEAWKDKYKCVICGKGFRSSTKLRVRQETCLKDTKMLEYVWNKKFMDFFYGCRNIPIFIVAKLMRIFANFVVNPFVSIHPYRHTE